MSLRTLGAVLLLPLILGVVSCKQKKEQTAQALPLDTIYVQDSIPFFQGMDYPHLYVDIEYIYPEDKALTVPFNSIVFNDTVSSSARQAVDRFIAQITRDFTPDTTDVAENWGKSLAEMSSSSDAYVLNTFTSLHSDVLYQDDQIISVEVASELFPGGAAHGFHTNTFYNLTLPQGRIITESDLFKDNYKEELHKILLEQLRLDYEKQSPEDRGGVEADFYTFFTTESVVPNGNFAVEPDGLSYCYNEYEIAPYAYGAVYVFIPYELLQGIAKPESPLKHLIFGK